ncbi:MAG: trypsin-like peptidase domain-containing protein [Planctomycetota bacterium]
MRRFVAYGPALVVLLIAVCAMFVVPDVLRRSAAIRTAALIEHAEATLDQSNVLTQFDVATRAVAQAVEPSVVHIDINGGRSSGSGWVYDDAGHIITNAHVVRGATSIKVQFFDGQVVEGTLTGSDALTDVAVIKVAVQPGLFAARRASDANPQQGEHVFAFGSPFGFKFSMSQGIISGLGRIAGPAAELGGFSNLIQTDAAVNPGNSGGPLADVRGRVVGMNVAIATARTERGGGGDEGQSAGISFAIPIATIEYIADQLIAGGKVLRGYLGIEFSPDDERQIYDGDRYKGTGLLLGRVSRGGPSDAAGLRGGDVIMEIKGKPVTRRQTLRSIVATIKPGEGVNIRYWRPVRVGGEAGEFRDTTVVLGQMPPEALIAGPPNIFILTQTGIEFSRTELGLMVVSVFRGTPAEAAGFKSGMILTAIGGTPVSTFREAATALIEHGWLNDLEVSFSITEIDGDRLSASKTLKARMGDAWPGFRVR